MWRTQRFLKKQLFRDWITPYTSMPILVAMPQILPMNMDLTLDRQTCLTIVPEIHAGLLSHSPDGTEIRLELAEDYAVSDDFTSYEFRAP